MSEKNRWYVIIFSVALAARLLFFGLYLANDPVNGLITGDAQQYINFGHSLATGEGYIDKEDGNGRPIAYRPPGYPAYLAFFELLGLPLWFAVFIQIIFASLIPVSILLFAERFPELPQWVGRGAALFAALDPLQIFYSVTVVADVFMAFLIISGLFSFLRWWETKQTKWIVASGALMAASLYFRPVGIYLLLFLSLVTVGWHVWKKLLTRTIALQLLFGLIALSIVIIPWQIRNYKTFGDFSFTSLGLVNFYVYGAPSVISIQTGRNFDDIKTELTDRVKKEAPDPLYVESLQNKSYVTKQSLNIIKMYPVAYIKAYLLGVNTLLFSGNYHFFLQRHGWLTPPEEVFSLSLIIGQHGPIEAVKRVLLSITNPYILIAIGGKLLWLTMTISALWAAWRFRAKPLSIIFITTVVYFILTILPMGLGVEARYRYSLNPLIALFAFSTFYYIGTWIKERRK